MSKVIDLQNVTKVYKRGREEVHALREVSLSVEAGEFLALVGPSGSGKTTLLQLIGCIDRPTSGRVVLAGEEVSALDESRLTKFRSQAIGFIFQQFYLLPTLSALENVELPRLFARDKKLDGLARQLLEQVGLGDRLNHSPAQLSGGEMQRVAIARALINNPKVLLADEPTGNLDSKNAEAVLQLFKDFHAQGQTILMVTHNNELAASAQRVIRLKDGQLTS